MESFLRAVPVRLQMFYVRPLTALVIVQFQEGTSFIDSLLTAYDSYLETLESQVAEQNRLQARINELEERLREIDPSVNLFSKSSTTQQFLTPPETSNTQVQSATHLSPTFDSA